LIAVNRPQMPFQESDMGRIPVLLKTWSQTTSPHPVMRYEFNRITILDPGIFAGNPLIDGHEEFFLFHEFEDLLHRFPLALDQLADGHRFREMAGQVPLALCRLQLAH
jgi:hypothetical protein